jgi:polycystin 1L2
LTIDQYWEWLEQSFVSNIRAQNWYNGQPPLNLSGFIDDKSNRLIGWATMRQLRVKPDLCHVPGSVRQLISTCHADYSLLNEEQRSFEPGWSNQTTTVCSSTICRAFEYQSGDQLDTYMYAGDHATYGSGGYVYEFRGHLSDLQSNLSQLHELQWIDGQTRAVIIQMSLYNPNAQMFTSVSFLVELLSTGGVFPQARFEPITFQRTFLTSKLPDFSLSRLEFTSIFQVVCVILYIVFIVYFMIAEVASLFRLKFTYFRQFWSWIELGIIGCSWAGVGIYVWRYRELTRIGSLFQETNGYVYVNLQLAAYVNDVFTFLLGFCCFLSSLKFLRLCRFDHRLSLLTKTLQHAGKALASFSFMFSIIFMAFLALFYLLFVSKILACSSLLHTAQMLFEMTSLKFDVSELREADAFLGPFCFSLFIFLVVFVCMSMFISIIRNSFCTVRHNAFNEDQEILAFMIHKFQRWTGE